MRPVYLKFLPAVLSAGLIGLTGCNNEYSLENEEVVAFRHAYEDNFVKTFGSIDPNQSWDFSSYAKQKRQSESQTRAVTQYVSVAKTDGVNDEWYSVESNTVSWLTSYLPEQTNNSAKIKANSFRADEATIFEIVPFYQGAAALYWELHLCTKVDDSSWTDRVVWTKGYNFEEYCYGDWHGVGSTNVDCNSLDAEKLRCKPVEINIPANCSFYFYLKNERNDDYHQAQHLTNAVGQCNSSIDNPPQIGALQGMTCPDNIPDEYSCVVLACEDMKAADGVPAEYCDYDYNDMVFLLVGYVPEIIYYVEEEETIIRKRYLIEDFGGFDYDFNDIIVDVAQTTTTKYNVNSETFTKERVSSEVGQEATISYFCGTMPVQVKVGNTFFGQVTDPTNAAIVEDQLARGSEEFGGPVCTRTVPPTGTTVNYTKEVTGWVPDDNNISVYVWTKKNPGVERPEAQTVDIWTTTGIWTSTFPENGAVPYIIAVDQGEIPDGEGIQYSKITVETQQ